MLVFFVSSFCYVHLRRASGSWLSMQQSLYRNIITGSSRVHATGKILEFHFNLQYMCFRMTLVSWNVREESYKVPFSVVHVVCRRNYHRLGGRDCVVSIATRYCLDGPGIEYRRGRDFSHPSRPALGPTQPPIQWVPGLSRG